MKAFVTGCARFIGSHITDTFNELSTSHLKLDKTPKVLKDETIPSVSWCYKQYLAKDASINQTNC